MGFSIHYRSAESMHPAQAYAIKQHAHQLIDGFTWLACEPVSLHHASDGYLIGHSKPSFFPAEIDAHEAGLEGLPDGTVLTLAEVLCVLSREHGVDWDIGHDYEPEPIGHICNGVADANLLEQLETVGSLGDLLDDTWDDLDPDWDTTESERLDPARTDEDRDDEGPRLLKFPGPE